jgi:hypothetical protein
MKRSVLNLIIETIDVEPLKDVEPYYRNDIKIDIKPADYKDEVDPADEYGSTSRPLI